MAGSMIANHRKPVLALREAAKNDAFRWPWPRKQASPFSSADSARPAGSHCTDRDEEGSRARSRQLARCRRVLRVAARTRHVCRRAGAATIANMRWSACGTVMRTVGAGVGYKPRSGRRHVQDREALLELRRDRGTCDREVFCVLPQVFVFQSVVARVCSDAHLARNLRSGGATEAETDEHWEEGTSAGLSERRTGKRRLPPECLIRCDRDGSSSEVGLWVHPERLLRSDIGVIPLLGRGWP